MKNICFFISLAMLLGQPAFAAGTCGSDCYNTPNMGLDIPTPGVATGPDWANDVNNSLVLLDAHDHSPGKGVQITPLGLNINSNLTFNGNFATNVGGVFFTAQASNPGQNATIYSKGVDLYYKDGSGNIIQITSGGGVNGTPGSISNLSAPASASFVSASGTFVWQSNTGIAASMDAGAYILRYSGSYPAPSGNYIALEAPTSLSTGYALIFPANVPSSSGAFLTESTAGQLGYTNVDGSTVAITSNILGVVPQGIGTTQIANQAVTATQIANNTITRAQEAAIGQQVSGNSGTFTNSTNTATQITNQSVSLTTHGRPVEIFFQSGGAGNFTSIFSTAPVTSQLLLERDGVGIATWWVPYGNAGSGLTGLTFLDPSPSAASHTYNFVIFSGASTTVTAQNFVTAAYEL